MWQEEDGRSGDGHGAWTDIALRRSTDDGQTWGPIQAICRNSTLGKDGKRDKALEDTCVGRSNAAFRFIEHPG